MTDRCVHRARQMRKGATTGRLNIIIISTRKLRKIALVSR